MKKKKFSDLFEFLPKSKVKAGDGREVGKYPFFKSGKDQSKRVNRAIYSGEYLIIGDGGSANVTYYNGEFSTSDHCYVATLKDTKSFYTPYIYLYLKSNLHILEAGFKGVAIKNISKKYISNIKIPLPERLNDQIKIANLLMQVDSFIGKREESIKLLDELLKCTFLDMFGDPVLNEREWETVPFHEAGKFVSGGTPSKSRNDFWKGSFPWVSPKDMKVLKIEDSIDHISEAVFEETSLKRIVPSHLLIVVRGMILEHSFPVAINLVEIAINQDMKAIKPIAGMNVIYLQYCLISLKRQILKLISTAGHGTRKFDSTAIKKLLIPKPPDSIQDQFATIVQQVEATKAHYQESLDELNELFESLSQRAFRGELDLDKMDRQNKGNLEKAFSSKEIA